METGAYYGLLFAGTMDAMCFWDGAYLAVPVSVLGWYMPGRWWNAGQVDNAHYNDLINEALELVDYDEWRIKLREANDYSFEQKWAVNMIPVRYYYAWQPWLGGYHGEQLLGAWRSADVWARI